MLGVKGEAYVFLAMLYVLAGAWFYYVKYVERVDSFPICLLSVVGFTFVAHRCLRWLFDQSARMVNQSATE